MLAPIKTRGLALLGLIGMIPIALGLARGTLSLDAAGIRALVLLGTLLVIEKFVLPICISIVRPDRRGPGPL